MKTQVDREYLVNLIEHLHNTYYDESLAEHLELIRILACVLPTVSLLTALRSTFMIKATNATVSMAWEDLLKETREVLVERQLDADKLLKGLE